MVVRFSLNMDVVYEKSWPIIDLFSSCTDKSQSISLGKGISISYTIIQKSWLNGMLGNILMIFSHKLDLSSTCTLIPLLGR